MIELKSRREIGLMYDSGQISYEAMMKAGEMIRPGITTREIDAVIERAIRKAGAIPSFKGYGGFPAAACISVNETVVHGFPSDRELREGDIVSVDLGALYRGYHSDMARTFPVGEIAAKHSKLIEVTERCFWTGLEKAVAGNHVGDISAAVQDLAESSGYGVVRDLTGHGVGRQLHEDPSVPNFYERRGPVLKNGMTIAIEPMINLGTWEVSFGKDGWNVVTKDGEYSAHYENTVAVTENGPVVLTMPEGTY